MVESKRRPALSAADPAPPRVAVVARILLAVAVVVIAVIVFTPGPPDASGQHELARWLNRVHQTWMPGWVSFALIEFLSNVLMFVPLGLLGALALRRHRWIAVLACAIGSALIEVTQRLALPGRDGTVQDVVANTVGALLGFGIAVLLAYRWRTRSRQRSPV